MATRGVYLCGNVLAACQPGHTHRLHGSVVKLTIARSGINRSPRTRTNREAMLKLCGLTLSTLSA